VLDPAPICNAYDVGLDPGATGGIDLESELIEELAAEHANIGIKVTYAQFLCCAFYRGCGNVGKLTRIAATTSGPFWIEAHPRTMNSCKGLCLGDFLKVEM
jgi:4-hydroxy-2-oxoglutarate aldolase